MIITVGFITDYSLQRPQQYYITIFLSKEEPIQIVVGNLLLFHPTDYVGSARSVMDQFIKS